MPEAAGGLSGPALSRAAAGALASAALGAASAARLAPHEQDPLLALLLVCGLALPAPTGAAPRRAAGWLGLLAIAASGVAPLPALGGSALSGAGLLACGWAAAGALRAASSGNRLGAVDPLRAAAGALAGALLPLLLAALLPPRPLVALPLLSLAALAQALLGREGETPLAAAPVGRAAARRLGALTAGISALHAGLWLPLLALGLVVRGGSSGVGGAPWTLGALALGAGALVGLVAARALPRGLGAWLLAELAGWLLLGGLAAWLPELGRSGLLGLGLLGGVAAGVGLGGPLRAGGARGLIAIGLAPLVWGPLLAQAAAGWSPAAHLALALGVTPDPALARAAALAEDDLAGGQGRVRLRWERLGPPSVQVLELGEGESSARLLFVDTRLQGATPTRAGESPRLLAGPTLLGALAGALAPGRATLLGLSTGVAANVARLAAPEGAVVVEPARGVRALLDDPGDLFGLANDHLRADSPGVSLREEGLRAHLLGAGAGPFACAGPDPDPALVGQAAGRGSVAFLLGPEQGIAAPGTAAPAGREALSLPARLRARAPEGAWVFAPGGPEGDLVVLRGPPELDAVALLRRAETAPVASALGQAGLAPIDLLATCVADPAAARRALDGAGEGFLGALLRAGAAGDGPALRLPADRTQAAALLLDLGEAAGRRRLPAALPWVRRALELERTPRGLVAWGDLLYRDHREGEALAAWEEALRVEPGALPPRISIATHRRNAQDLAGAAEVLQAGLTGEPGHDAPLHYLLGELREVEGDDAAAAEQFRLAGEHRDAPERAARARERGRGGQASPLSVADRLRAARELLDRARGAAPAEAEARRLEALELVLPLASAGGDLAEEQRRQAARLLERLAEDEPVEALRQNVHRRAADLLAPLGEPRDRLERARALVRAGQPEAAQELLGPLQEGPQAARAHLVLGEALRARGHLAEAIAAWERGLALQPPSSADVWALEAIAEAERERGQPQRALRALEQAEELAPGLPRLRLARARLLEALDRPGDALAAWRAFLTVAGPGDPARAEAARRVAELEARRGR